ncbi:MAG: hypothetical protein R3E96_15030 [Planctomycetota bacterium]
MPTAQPVLSPAISIVFEDQETFRKKYRTAREINNKKEMKRLIQLNQDLAVNWIMETAYGNAVTPTDEELSLLTSLDETWKDAYRTDFVVEMRRFFDGLQGDRIREYNGLVKQYNELQAAYFKAVEAGAEPSEMVRFAQNFENMGQLCTGFHGGLLRGPVLGVRGGSLGQGEGPGTAGPEEGVFRLRREHRHPREDRAQGQPAPDLAAALQRVGRQGVWTRGGPAARCG